VGVLSADAGIAQYGVTVDAEESPGLSDAAPLGQMFEHGDGGRLRQVAAVQGRALAFREAGATLIAAELSVLLVFAEPATDREVAGVAMSIERTVRVLAAEKGEIVHGAR
jgi:hypothetical protein